MKIVFMGTPPFAATVLQRLIDEGFDISLVVSQPDRPVGRKKILTPPPVKAVAQKHNLPVFQPEKIKLDHETILNVQPDLLITAAYGQIIPKSLIDLPKLGCINVHASLLPKYRGGAPIHQAIIDGEKETGVTIMYMDVTMDTGDIISTAKAPILDEDNVGTLFEKMSHIGADLLINTLPSIENRTNQRLPQNHDEATYAYNIKREDEKVNWNKSARGVFNHIRGLYPWPTAYTTISLEIDPIPVKLFHSQLLNSPANEPAGTITAVTTAGIDVSCGDGQLLRITQLQLAGKKRMPLADLLNGDHPFLVGKKFD